MAYIFVDGQWQLKNQHVQKALVDFVGERSRAFYLYDLDDAVLRAKAYKATGAEVHYAMKANALPRLLKQFAGLGLGADVVSLGEMQKAMGHGIPADRIIFSGVAKDKEEFEAAISNRILQINVESFEELKNLESVCQTLNKSIDVALRVNILLTAPTHKHVQTATPLSKFGLDLRQLPEVLTWLKGDRRVRLRALTVHIGSQITDVDVFANMSREIGRLYRDVKAQGFKLERLDLGGGLGIDYQSAGQDDLPFLARYLEVVTNAHQTDARILFEPGRFLVARMGVLLARVVYVKQTPERQFLILNAGMNALMRPALYESFHRIIPLSPRGQEMVEYDVVGPICESTDVFAAGRSMPQCLAGDWVAIFDAGAYGAVMANTYNESPYPDQVSLLGERMEIL